MYCRCLQYLQAYAISVFENMIVHVFSHVIQQYASCPSNFLLIHIRRFMGVLSFNVCTYRLWCRTGRPVLPQRTLFFLILRYIYKALLQSPKFKVIILCQANEKGFLIFIFIFWRYTQIMNGPSYTKAVFLKFNTPSLEHKPSCLQTPPRC